MTKPYAYIITITPKGVYQEQRQTDKTLTADDMEILHFLVKVTRDGAAEVDDVGQHIGKSRLTTLDLAKLLDEDGYVRLRFMHDMNW